MNLKMLISGLVCVAVVLAAGTAQAQLVAWYEFDGDNTDSVGSADASGGSNYGTGNRGQALDVAGSGSNAVQAPVTISPGIAPKVTIGGWVYLTDGGPYQAIIQQDGDWARKIVVDNRGATWPTAYMGVFNGFTDAAALSGFLGVKTPVPTGSWEFVAATYDNTTSTTTGYSGTSSAVDTDSFMRIATGKFDLSIGAIQQNWEPVKGLVDDVFVFNGVLTAAELDSIRTAANPLTAAQTISAGMSKVADDAITTVKMDFQGSGDTTAQGLTAGWETWQPVYRNSGGATATAMVDVDNSATTWGFQLLNGLDGDWNNGDGDHAAIDYWYTLGSGDSYSPNWELNGLTAGASYRLTPITGQGGAPLFILPDQDGDGNNFLGGGSDTYTVAETFSGQTRSITAVAASNGKIVGEFYFNQFWEGQVAGMVVELTGIPEPGTFVLFGLGALGLALYGWRRRK